MIRINLLPFRAARKTENIRRQVSLFCLSLIMVGLLMFVVHAWFKKDIERLTAELDQSKKELAIYKKDAQKVREMKKQLAKLQQQNDVIVKLDMNRKDPVNLLKEMTEVIVPNRMWFNSLNATGKNIVISGVSLDNKTTADFMMRLEESPLFSDVTLKSIRKSNNLKNFGITCLRTTPQKSDPKKSDKK